MWQLISYKTNTLRLLFIQYHANSFHQFSGVFIRAHSRQHCAKIYEVNPPLEFNALNANV